MFNDTFARGQELDDAVLVVACQRGDSTAFDQLYERHHQMVWRLACRSTHSAEDAEDVAQEVFLHALRRLPDFRGDCPFGAWLHRIALNCCVDFQRSAHARHPGLPLDGLNALPAGENADPELACEGRDLRECVRRAAADLPESQRAVFLLVALERQSYEEAARSLHMPVRTVRKRMSRARLELRRRSLPCLGQGV